MDTMHAATRISIPAALSSAGFALACLLFAWLWSDYSDYWLDDAFISFRYSRHLGEGLGPVYNPGERAEGYTSFLWMLLAGLPLRLASGAAALVAIKASSLVASLWILYRVWTFPSPTRAVRRWWVLVLATQPVFVLSSGDGMETPLFVVLMLECVLALQHEPTRRSGVGVGLLTAAMILTRPESLPLLVALPVLVGFAHRADRAGREDVLRWTRAFLIAGLLPVLCHEAWRWGYYGYPLPNTYYAKATGSQLERLSRGARDLGRFLFENPWRPPVAIWVATGLAGLASHKLMARTRPEVVRWLGALWLMVVFRLSFDLWSGSDAMGRHRFLAPLLVPLAILADEGARFAWRVAGSDAGRRAQRRAARAFVVALFALSIYFNVTGHWNHEWAASHYRRGLERAHIALGHWLRETYPAETVLAIGDAGAVPFFSRLATIDLWGLNHTTIAHMPGEYGRKAAMADYVLGREPDLVVLWNQVPFLDGDTGRVVGGTELDRDVARHPGFGSDYRFVREFVFREHGPEVPGYYLDVFERK